jgi:hypothetical protein
MAANPSVDALIASTQRFYAHNKFEDQVYDGRPMLAWMKANGAIREYTGGNPIYEPLREGANTTIRPMANFDEFDFTPQDGFGAAQYNPKAFSATVVLDWATRFDNSGSVRVIDLWNAKVEQAKDATQDYFNRIILTGDGTNSLELVGLPVMVATTGTYGNIARSGNTFWQSYVDTTVGPLSDNQIRTLANTVSRNKNDNGPDIHATTQILYEKYNEMLLPAYRFTDKRMADLGFNSLQWNGKPVIYDGAIGAGIWYALNTRYFAIRPNSNANFMMTDKRNPMKQAVDGMAIYWRGAITCRGCRFLGKLTGKTT